MLPAGCGGRAYPSMAGNGNGTPPPYSKARAAGGLFLFVTVGVLSVIDSMRNDYILELGPMALMLGTGTVLLGVEGLRQAADRIISGK